MSDSLIDLATKADSATALPRRSLLKGTAGILATGLFPAVHSAEPIVLRYLGTAVNQDKAIADKFKADLVLLHDTDFAHFARLAQAAQQLLCLVAVDGFDRVTPRAIDSAGLPMTQR